MHLKKLELLGAAAAFIPGVSTVTSVMKARYYANKAVQKNQLKLIQKANDVAKNKLDVRDDKIKCYNSLKNASIFEAIPFVNVIAAIYSAVILAKLSNLRDVNKSDQGKQDYLCSKYNVQKSTYSKEFLQALKLVDSFDFKKHNLFIQKKLPPFDDIENALKNRILVACQQICMNAGGNENSLKKLIKACIETTREDLVQIVENIEFEEINYDTLDQYWEELIYTFFLYKEKNYQLTGLI